MDNEREVVSLLSVKNCHIKVQVINIIYGYLIHLIKGLRFQSFSRSNSKEVNSYKMVCLYCPKRD